MYEQLDLRDDAIAMLKAITPPAHAIDFGPHAIDFAKKRLAVLGKK